MNHNQGWWFSFSSSLRDGANAAAQSSAHENKERQNPPWLIGAMAP